MKTDDIWRKHWGTDMDCKNNMNVNGKIYSTVSLDKELNISRGISTEIKGYLLLEAVFLGSVLLRDLFHIFDKWCQLVGKCLKEINPVLYEFAKSIKCMLWEGQEAVLNVVLTLGTILAAAVIFFYSVQDNEKGGIPNRTIMSYTSGSQAVPVLFLTVMVMLPVNYLTFFLGLRYFAWAVALCTYITQMMIIIIILESTSHTYSMYAVCNAEIQQYQKLVELEKMKEEQRKAGLEAGEKYSFIWIYLLQHIEQVLLSEELITTKLENARYLLRVPYYKREVWIWGEWIKILGKARERLLGTADAGLKISAGRLEDNHLGALYEFYYRNLITVLQHVNQQERREERNKIYLILYDFLEELTGLYEDMEESGECRYYYAMTVCGIMNAVMDSNVEESAEFCNYVFNYLVSENVWQFQMCLYILFQEYLYRVNEDAVRPDALEGMKQPAAWRFEDVSGKDREKCWEFWHIWTVHTTLSESSRDEYLIKAFLTLEEGWNESVPIMYIREKLRG